MKKDNTLESGFSESFGRHLKSSMSLEVSECKQFALLLRYSLTFPLATPPLPSDPSSENSADRGTKSRYIKSILQCKL